MSQTQGPCKDGVFSGSASRRSRWLLAWALVVAVAATTAVLRLQVQNPTGHWEPKDRDPESVLWDFTRRQFGRGEVVLLGVPLPDSAAPRLSATAHLEEWLIAQPEVSTSFGPANVRSFGRNLRVRLSLGPQLADLEEAVLRHDPNVALIFVTLHPPPVPGSLELKETFLDRLSREGVAYAPLPEQVVVAGKPVADVALNRLLRRDTIRSAPTAMLVMALVLLLVLRRGSIGPFVGVGSAVVVVIGGLAAVGEPISTATVVTLPITAVVGLAYGIHVESAIARTGQVRTALQIMTTPLRWAFITTAVALLSFALSPFPALRSYAYTAAGGVAAGYLAAFTLVPYLTAPRQDPRRPRAWEGIGFRLFARAARHRNRTAGAWALAVVAIVLGLVRLQVEPNNYLGFFPSDHPTVESHRVLDDLFGGSLPMFVLAGVDTGSAYHQRAVRDRLQAFVDDAKNHPHVGSAFVPFLVTGKTGAFLQEWFEGQDERFTRGVFSIPLLTTQDTRELMRFLDSLALHHSNAQIRLQVTGAMKAGLPFLQALVKSQIQSLGLVLLAVLAAFTVATRSLTIGSFLFLPNLLAPAAVGAVMGYLRIPLDFTTVVIFSMVLGIAVDDTLQLVWAGAPEGSSGTFAGPVAVRHVVKPITLTSLAAAVGFVSLALSPFPVTQRLGLLMAVGLVVAWLADVTVTPLLLSGRRLGRGSNTKR